MKKIFNKALLFFTWCAIVLTLISCGNKNTNKEADKDANNATKIEETSSQPVKNNTVDEEPSIDDQYESDIPGHYQMSTNIDGGGQVKAEVELLPDNTFTYDGAFEIQNNRITFSFSGNWKIENGMLMQTITNVETPDENLKQKILNDNKINSKIVNLNSNTLVLEENGDVTNYTRMND